MFHFFDEKVACEYGEDLAIIISKFQFWIFHNKANGANEREGRTWTFNSIEALCSLFPFWTRDQIRRKIDMLVKKEILLRQHHNKKGYDRTSWYAFQDESIWLNRHLHLADSPNRFGRNARPIPDNTTEYNSDNTFPKGKAAKKKVSLKKGENGAAGQVVFEMFQYWAEHYQAQTGIEIFERKIDGDGREYWAGMPGKYAKHLKDFASWLSEVKKERDPLEAWQHYLEAAWEYGDAYTRKNFTPDHLVPKKANIIAAIKLGQEEKAKKAGPDYSSIYTPEGQ